MLFSLERRIFFQTLDVSLAKFFYALLQTECVPPKFTRRSPDLQRDGF